MGNGNLLTHLYVLIPVFGNGKHHWIGDDEIEKLLAKGEGWRPGTRRKRRYATISRNTASVWLARHG